MHPQVRIVFVCVAFENQNHSRVFVTHGEAIGQSAAFVFLDKCSERRKSSLESLNVLGPSKCYLDDKPKCTCKDLREGEEEGRGLREQFTRQVGNEERTCGWPLHSFDNTHNQQNRTRVRERYGLECSYSRWETKKGGAC